MNLLKGEVVVPTDAWERQQRRGFDAMPPGLECIRCSTLVCPKDNLQSMLLHMLFAFRAKILILSTQISTLDDSLGVNVTFVRRRIAFQITAGRGFLFCHLLLDNIHYHVAAPYIIIIIP